jgi:uncharacterized protein YcfJ
MLTGTVLGVAVATAVGGIAGYQMLSGPELVEVLAVTQVTGTLTDVSQRSVGYDVQYRLGDQTGQVRMDYDPGSVIPVHDGQLVLSRTGAARPGEG